MLELNVTKSRDVPEHPYTTAELLTPPEGCDDGTSLCPGMSAETYWLTVAQFWPRLLAILGWRFGGASRMLVEDMVMSGAIKKARQCHKLTAGTLLGEVLLAATDAMRAWRGREARLSDVLAQAEWPSHRSQVPLVRQVLASHDLAYYVSKLSPLGRERLLTTLLSDAPPPPNHSPARWRLDTGAAKARRTIRRFAAQEY